ncbi:MAG: hypothetical protein ACREQT_00700 [Candidatus Binataceae bacterium]
MERMKTVGYWAVIALNDAESFAIVAACVDLANELGTDVDLAGSWILDRARMRIPNLWIPNFRPFVTLGILNRVGGSRGGRRAYYRLVDASGSQRALVERGVPLVALASARPA